MSNSIELNLAKCCGTCKHHSYLGIWHPVLVCSMDRDLAVDILTICDNFDAIVMEGDNVGERHIGSIPPESKA